MGAPRRGALEGVRGGRAVCDRAVGEAVQGAPGGEEDRLGNATKTFPKEAEWVKTDAEHLVLLARLLARLRDGHAEVRPLDKAKGVKFPDDGKGPRVGPGLFLCRSGKKIWVKNSWEAAAEVGVAAGSEVLNWGRARRNVAPRSDHQDFRSHRLRDRAARVLPRVIGGSPSPRGPSSISSCAPPMARKSIRPSRTATLHPCRMARPTRPSSSRAPKMYLREDRGRVWLHPRPALRRGSSHSNRRGAREGRRGPRSRPRFSWELRRRHRPRGAHGAFRAEGEDDRLREPLPERRPRPYAGPVVVIIDGTIRSTGETASGIFKEDGRAYMIGESATAGMSSQKTTIALPSGLFSSMSRSPPTKRASTTAPGSRASASNPTKSWS